MTTVVGMSPACRLRTAPKPTASELSTTAGAAGAAGARGVLVAVRCIQSGERFGFGCLMRTGLTVAAPSGDVTCQLARHVAGADHKATERSERAGGRRPHEVEARYGRFEPDIELGISLACPHRLTEGRRQKRVARDVYAVTGAEEEVIHESCRAVSELEPKPRPDRLRREDGTARRDRNRCETRR